VTEEEFGALLQPKILTMSTVTDSMVEMGPLLQHLLRQLNQNQLRLEILTKKCARMTIALIIEVDKPAPQMGRRASHG